jgi:hypothetical protein
MFENRELKRIPGYDVEEVKRAWRKLHKEGIHN